MKLTQIYRAITEAEEVAQEQDELSGFLDLMAKLEQHAKERKVLEPNYSRDDLIDDIKREEPDMEDSKANKMADFVFDHLSEDISNYAAIPEEHAATAEELDVGDPVKITGNVSGQGQTGTIDSFGQDKRFVIVQVDGKLNSYHSSDVSFAAQDENDESEIEEATPAMPKMSAEEMVLHRNTIKQMAEKMAELNRRYVLAKNQGNTELMNKIKAKLAEIAADKSDILAHIDSRQRQLAESTVTGKFHRQDRKVIDSRNNVIVECASARLAQDITEILNTRLIQKKKLAEDTAFSVKAFNAAVGKALMEAEGDPEGIPHLTKSLLKNILKGVGEEGAHAIVKSLEWGDGAAKELLELITNDLKKHVGIEESVKQRLDPKCWKGKHKEGTKIKGGVRVNNCVPNESIDENFADGKNPQDIGDAKRHGVDTKGSVSSLRKTAKQGGRKGQLAHWMANMKAGKAKKESVTESTEQSLQKKIQAKRDALSLAREQRRARGNHQQGQREIKLQAEIDRLSTELTQLKQQSVAEATSAAVRMQRAADRQRAKSDASLQRTPSSIPKKEEPKTATPAIKEFAPGGNFKPPAIPKGKGNDPWGDDDRSQIAQAVKGLLASGNKVDWQVPGQMGHVVSVDDRYITLRKWNQPRSKMRFALRITADRDSKYQIVPKGEKHYRVISSGLNEGKQDMTKGENHWYDAGVKDARRGVKPNPRTYALKDPEPKHPEEIDYYMTGYKSVKKSVTEGKSRKMAQQAAIAIAKKKVMSEDSKECPVATQDIKTNLENRQKAIDEYGYGPLNPDLPNTKFWMKKVDEWNLDSADEAKESLCGNCAAFDQRQKTLDCIAQGIDSDQPNDAEGVIEAGDLGYCKFLKFKCASRRTCDAWVTGGPLTDDAKSVDESDMALKFATQAHTGQTRSGGEPYITHPMRVADSIRQYKQSHNLEALIDAALLHDTIEDTDTTHEALQDLFGGLVASLVKELTSDPEKIKKMGKAAYLANKMATMSSYALVIKLADRLDNVKDIATAKTPEWRAKYKAETLHILDYIAKNRVLSGTHQKLIGLIRSKLNEINDTKEVEENLTLAQQFDIIEEMVNNLASTHGVDADIIWEDFDAVDDETLFEVAAWQTKAGKNKKGGLNKKGVASYRRQHPGSKLQTAVTTKPSKLKPGSKAAKRRKSFCARMGGMKGPMKDKNGKPTRKALALRKWNCNESVDNNRENVTVEYDDEFDMWNVVAWNPSSTANRSGKTLKKFRSQDAAEAYARTVKSQTVSEYRTSFNKDGTIDSEKFAVKGRVEHGLIGPGTIRKIVGNSIYVQSDRDGRIYRLSASSLEILKDNGKDINKVVSEDRVSKVSVITEYKNFKKNKK